MALPIRVDGLPNRTVKLSFGRLGLSLHIDQTPFWRLKSRFQCPLRTYD